MSILICVGIILMILISIHVCTDNFSIMNLFGKKKPKPSMNESILKLRETISQLEKREKHLQNQADQCIVQARQKSKKKDKRGTHITHTRTHLFMLSIRRTH